MTRRVMVDMSATLVHDGHIILLERASTLGSVVVALTSDDEIEATKGYRPELRFSQRKKILSSIKFVSEIVESPWLITENFLDFHKCDLLVHGEDNENRVPRSRTVIFPRTNGISSSDLRAKSAVVQAELTARKSLKD